MAGLSPGACLAGYVFRAHFILAIADGLTYRQTERSWRECSHGIEVEGPLRGARHRRFAGSAFGKYPRTSFPQQGCCEI